MLGMKPTVAVKSGGALAGCGGQNCPRINPNIRAVWGRLGRSGASHSTKLVKYQCAWIGRYGRTLKHSARSPVRLLRGSSGLAHTRARLGHPSLPIQSVQSIRSRSSQALITTTLATIFAHTHTQENDNAQPQLTVTTAVNRGDLVPDLIQSVKACVVLARTHNIHNEQRRRCSTSYIVWTSTTDPTAFDSPLETNHILAASR